MKTEVGLWIDYREAVIVTCMNQREQIRRIPSHIEELVSDADAPHVSQQDRHNKRLDAHLSRYYGQVIGVIRHADSIVIFGPGKAKGELQTKLESQGLAEQVVAVETTDSMTVDQITAKVREHFRKRNSDHETQNTD
jgi:stalled ribosome rescue protein Dom34